MCRQGSRDLLDGGHSVRKRAIISRKLRRRTPGGILVDGEGLAGGRCKKSGGEGRGRGVRLLRQRPRTMYSWEEERGVKASQATTLAQIKTTPSMEGHTPPYQAIFVIEQPHQMPPSLMVTPVTVTPSYRPSRSISLPALLSRARGLRCPRRSRASSPRNALLCEQWRARWAEWERRRRDDGEGRASMLEIMRQMTQGLTLPSPFSPDTGHLRCHS